MLRTDGDDGLAVRLRGGRYLAPLAPGFSATMRPGSLTRYAYPDGPQWTGGTR